VKRFAVVIEATFMTGISMSNDIHVGAVVVMRL
jgi:hypothetical protein